MFNFLLFSDIFILTFSYSRPSLFCVVLEWSMFFWT